MTIDYGALLCDPVYAELGVPAVFNSAEITVIGDTGPKALPIGRRRGPADVHSVGPGAFVRIDELTKKASPAPITPMPCSPSMAGPDAVVELRGSPTGEVLAGAFLLKEAALGYRRSWDHFGVLLEVAATVPNIRTTAQRRRHY
jgi:hypothetical protein